MLRNFLKNRKAQNTAEYALLIALVVAACIAGQTLVQRSLQAREHDATIYLEQTTNTIGTTNQYEPYYMQSDYNVATQSDDTKRLGKNLVGMDSESNRVRTGSQNTTYNGDTF